MTGLRARQPRNSSLILKRQEIFLLSKLSRSVLWPTQFVFNGYWGQSGRRVMLATHLHPVLGLRMNEMYLYCPIELYGMHGDNLTSAVRMHTITSHHQLLACTPLPHTLSCWHAHHYLTPYSSETHSKSRVFPSTFSSPNLYLPFIFSHWNFACFIFDICLHTKISVLFLECAVHFLLWFWELSAIISLPFSSCHRCALYFFVKHSLNSALTGDRRGAQCFGGETWGDEISWKT